MAAAMVAVPTVVTVAMRSPEDDGWGGERQFDACAESGGGHAHGDGGIAHAGIDAEYAGHGVAQDRQQGVEHQRYDGGLLRRCRR